jgi:acyl carrier protein
MSVADRLEKLFREVLDIREPVDFRTLKYNEYKTWNSLAHMTLVAAMETDFDIIMETDDILDMSSGEKALEILAKYDVRD